MMTEMFTGMNLLQVENQFSMELTFILIFQKLHPIGFQILTHGECEDYPRIEISANITPVFSEVVNPNVYVNQVCYTVDELVTDVLINNPCANVSNISFTSGNDFNDVNGIGHFIEPSGTFPFSEGIVLSTGDAIVSIRSKHRTWKC